MIKLKPKASTIKKVILPILIVIIISILIVILKNTKLLQRITIGNKAEVEQTKIEYEMILNEENNLKISLKLQNANRNRKGNTIRWNDIKCKK